MTELESNLAVYVGPNIDGKCELSMDIGGYTKTIEEVIYRESITDDIKGIHLKLERLNSLMRSRGLEISNYGYFSIFVEGRSVDDIVGSPNVNSTDAYIDQVGMSMRNPITTYRLAKESKILSSGAIHDEHICESILGIYNIVVSAQEELQSS